MKMEVHRCQLGIWKQTSRFCVLDYYKDPVMLGLVARRPRGFCLMIDGFISSLNGLKNITLVNYTSAMYRRNKMLNFCFRSSNAMHTYNTSEKFEKNFPNILLLNKDTKFGLIFKVLQSEH